MSKATNSNKAEVEIVSVDVMDVDKKLQEIRADVPFITNVIKTHRRDLSECQYTKLEKLVHLLGQNGKVPLTSLHKIENVIGKLKARFSSLLTPIETIDISHENSATSTPIETSPTTSTKSNSKILSTSTNDSRSSSPPISVVSTFAQSKANQTDSNKTKTNVPQGDGLRNPSPPSVKNTFKSTSHCRSDLEFFRGPCSIARKTNPSPCSNQQRKNVAALEDAIESLFETRLSQPSSTLEVVTPREVSDFFRRTNPIASGDAIRNLSPPCDQQILNLATSTVLSTVPPDFVRRSQPETGKGTQSGNSLEEARKKLAALRSLEVPLSSNINDPRGRKNHYTSCTTTAAGNVIHNSVSTTNVCVPPNLNLNQRPINSGADLQIPNIPLARNYEAATMSQATNITGLNGSVDGPLETRRDPNWSKQYSNDPRVQNNNYSSEHRKHPWNSNGYGNGHTRPGSSSILNSSGRLEAGSHHDGDSLNRFYDLGPRTYREHREAKARDEAAEAAEQQRKLLADLKRQQEANKKRQLEAVEKQRELDEKQEKTSVTVPTVSELQLDTSYRNCVLVGAPPKKIDFRIPKKNSTSTSSTVQELPKDNGQKTKDRSRPNQSSTEVCSPEKMSEKLPPKSSESGYVHTFNLENEPPLPSSSLEVGPRDVTVNEDADKDKNECNEKTKSSHKSKKRRKRHTTSESGKHSKEGVKNKKTNDKPEEKRKDEKNKHKEKKKEGNKEQIPQQKLTTKIKIVGLTGPSPQTKMVINNESDPTEGSNIGEENKDSTVSSPPRILKRRNTMAPIASDPLVGQRELPTNNSLLYEGMQVHQIATNKDMHLPQDGGDTSFDTSNQSASGTGVKDNPVQAAPRILKRRNTMAPIASEPLVDKRELFTNCSPLYEDMQVCQRGKTDKDLQLARSIATLFKKTVDNCTVSTQNIITGKRRTRGAEVCFNETLLSRKSFHMGPVTKPNIKGKTNSTEATEVTSTEDADKDMIKNTNGIKRKRDKNFTIKPLVDAKKLCSNTKNNVVDSSVEGQNDVKIDDVQKKAPIAAQSMVRPRVTKTRRPKRNELDKLNEDIAQMYYGEEVMRATGRRACTLQHHQPATNIDDSTATVPSRSTSPVFIRNVARRGVPFLYGPRTATDGCNRASFSIKHCRVRLQRCRSLQFQKLPSESDKSEQTVPSVGILNINPDWHALSSVFTQCVVCDKPIKKNCAVHHYIKFHGEPYGARLAPGMLNEIRQNRKNRPVYSLRRRSSNSLLHRYTCPFCKRTADYSTSAWYDHFAQHTGELRYRCSKCQKQFHRQVDGQRHVSSCNSDAQIILNESYVNRAPIDLYVCKLCEFVQKSRRNLLKHLQNHHDLKDFEASDKLNEVLETIQIYRVETVPAAPLKSVGTANIKTCTKNRKIISKKRFRSMAKKAFKVVKDGEDSELIKDIKENQPQNEILVTGEELKNGSPMVVIPHSATYPDTDPLLVTNDCKEKETRKTGSEEQQKIDKDIIFLDQDFELVSADQSKSVAIIELQSEDDNLSGIGSDDADEKNNQSGNENENIDAVKGSNEKDKNIATDEWIDLENDNRNSKSKSIFDKYNRFCTRLKKNGRSNGRTKLARAIASRSNSESSELISSDISEVMPTMTVLDPPMIDSNSATTTLPPPPTLTRVENVAFRRGAYFCTYANCTFLYSNEVEGLENHFALEHPSVRWSGRCLACEVRLQPTNISGESNLTIAQELIHMVKEHMEKPSSPSNEDENEKSMPLPAMPKLRVRRFSGDRLVSEVEKESSIPRANNNNTMLKDLLNSSPRPPNQQPIDFQAAGLSEFLTTKNVQNPESVLVNHASGLGLSINQVFSLAADQQTPSAHPEDFIVAQNSLTKNAKDQAQKQPQMNISIKPAPLPKRSSANSDPACTGLVADRFRCMAPKCGYCAHTVMCIREHMKFHSYSFGSNDYLKCAYCGHIGTDVEDYVQHGVNVHGLASVMELETESALARPVAGALNPETPGALSLTQQIRDVLNQRSRQSTSIPSAIPAVPFSTLPSLNVSATVAPRALALPSISAVIAELLRPTGYSEDKLYACPYKGCSVSLNGKIFVSHIRFHIGSTHKQDAEVKCKYCRTCLKPTELRNHLEKFHGKHTVFCALCIATALNRRLMHYHMKTKHEASFLLANRQLHFLQLLANGTDENIELAAIEHPFGKDQLEAFHKRLNDEWLKRQQNTKIYYRHSEMGLLPKAPSLPQLLKCADCNNFETPERKLMHLHLNHHKVDEITNAYQTEKPAVTQALPSVENAGNLGAPHVYHQHLIAEPPQPGQHTIMPPNLVYIPVDKLYYCGHSNCMQLMPTEIALRQHLSTHHSYKDGMLCTHCQYKFSGKSMTNALIDHLELHNQFIYQCGCCTRISNKRAIIERHIQEQHQASDVDVIMYRRDRMGVAMSSAKWFKAFKSPQSEYICNLCQHCLPTAAQIISHASVVHKKQHQYFCQHCEEEKGFIDPISLIRHLLAEHPGQPVQPVQVFQRLATKNRQTFGFYCLFCHEVASTRQRISGHCEADHGCKYQFKCAHCPYGHNIERNVATHMLEKHPFGLGRAIMQYETVYNKLPDDVCWVYLGNNIEDMSLSLVKDQQQLERQQPIIVDEIELISSSDEETIAADRTDDFNRIEFACSYCDETSHDVVDLRSRHWANTHGDQPFYFRVQPKLLCPECKQFQGNAKALLAHHLVKEHGIRNIVACDVRRPEECAYCDYQYTSWQNLACHMKRVGHRANDLKNVTDAYLHALKQCGTKGATTAINEYFQCVICKVIMPTCIAMGQHGRIQHSDAANFCFRRLTDDVIYHCFSCMYASTDEMETLRHMLDHYPTYQQCRFCHGQPLPNSDGFSQHRAAHPYENLRKYLMEMYYQFQNGLIITKSSLLRTKYCDETLMKTLDLELMHRPITQAKAQPITKRRKTLINSNTNPFTSGFLPIDTERVTVIPVARGTELRSTNATFVTSFTGSASSALASASSSSAAAVNTTPTRILKRRFTVVSDHCHAERQFMGD